MILLALFVRATPSPWMFDAAALEAVARAAASSTPPTDKQLKVIVRREYAFDALVKALPFLKRKFASKMYWGGCYKSAVMALMATEDRRLKSFSIERLDPATFVASVSKKIPPNFPWIEFSFLQWESRVSRRSRGSHC